MLKVCISYETGGGRLGGHFTQYAFTGLPGVEIAALADSNPAAEATYRLTGAKRLYTDFHAMMETEKPDIVVLCSRLPSEHREQIEYALKHCCHVFCEKPLAETLLQADALAELAHRSRKLVQMAHLARFAPTFGEMKRMIGAGEIGRRQLGLPGARALDAGAERLPALGVVAVADVEAWQGRGASSV